MMLTFSRQLLAVSTLIFSSHVVLKNFGDLNQIEF